MTEVITLTLNPQELNQLLEGLSERAESWEEIAESLRDSRSANTRSASQDQPKEGPVEGVAWGGNLEVGSRIARPSAEGMSWSEGMASGCPGKAAKDGDSGVQPERVRSMEALTAGLAATRIAVRYRNILDKILDQAQACGWKP